MHSPCRGRATGRQKDACRCIVTIEKGFRVLPIGGNAVMDDVALAGVADSRCQDAVERQPPMIGHEPAPGIDCTRNCDGMRTIGRNLSETAVPKPERISSFRGPARTVESDDLPDAARNKQ